MLVAFLSCGGSYAIGYKGNILILFKEGLLCMLNFVMFSLVCL